MMLPAACLAAAMVVAFRMSCFVGSSVAAFRDLQEPGLARGDLVARHGIKPVNTARYGGIPRMEYLKRLRHRRWAAKYKWPRTFGYVEKWSEDFREGIVIDQERTRTYIVRPEDISACYQNHKTLQRAEFIEFFATDQMAKSNIDLRERPLALNVTGAYGTYVKGSEEYINRMRRNKGEFPGRWKDDEKELPLQHKYWFLGKWKREARATYERRQHFNRMKNAIKYGPPLKPTE